MFDRNAIRLAHAVSGVVGLLVIGLFLASTIVVEVIGDHALVTVVKSAIAWGIPLLVPALAGAGLTGRSLSAGARGGRAGRKAARMRIVAFNGLFVLIPAALFLAWKAGSGAFDGLFLVVQGIELIAGGTNVVLLSLNMRDGLAMAARRKGRDMTRSAA